MARPEKEAAVQEIKEKLERSAAAILTDYRGLNVAEISELRRRMQDAGVEFRVVKNTLTRFAARELGLTEVEPYLEGPTAIAFGYDDPVAPAQVAAGFSREYRKLEFKGGILGNRVLAADSVKNLAELPPREVVLAQLLGGLQAPVVGLVQVLNGVPRNLAYALNAIKEQKEAAA